VLVQDNLSTHKRASLCEVFPPAEARRLVERFEWHYTPKHGSRLDMAESELSVLSGQCLDRRIPDKQTLIEEVSAWQEYRNKNHTKADWQFTTANARIKLKLFLGRFLSRRCAGTYPVTRRTRPDIDPARRFRQLSRQKTLFRWKRPGYRRRGQERRIDAVHWVRLDSRFGTERADHSRLPPISLSRLRQTVQ
jgi:hypothetical protein